jgi:hypothetical protein
MLGLGLESEKLHNILWVDRSIACAHTSPKICRVFRTRISARSTVRIRCLNHRAQLKRTCCVLQTNGQKRIYIVEGGILIGSLCETHFQKALDNGFLFIVLHLNFG